MNKENRKSCEIGIIGLGVMGRNLLLNMADKGFIVAGYDKDFEKVNSLKGEAEKRSIQGYLDIQEFINSLSLPRAILLLVPAGAAVDSIIQELKPYLEASDLIIDAGNSFFKDTDRRTSELEKNNLFFMGIGISGGEEGARHGPSIMPGGNPLAYQRIQKILEAIAAKFQSEPCVSYLGKGSAGHFVKMVHNGIEYGLMQLIAESYDLMKGGWGLNNTQLQTVYQNWNQGHLNSYLIEITSEIFKKDDEKTGKKLIDQISDIAKQLGTGMWTSQIAMELQVPAPSIDAAVMMRDLSSNVGDRQAMSVLYQNINNDIHHNVININKNISNPINDSANFLENPIIIALNQALYVGFIIVYAQGMAILHKASEYYQYDLNFETIAKIWRGGCIIRSALLQDIAKAYQNPSLTNLLLDPALSQKIIQHQNSLRDIVQMSSGLGIPTPGLMASLAYFDAFRSIKLPSNLIQAQRDYFGSHTYERIDSKGLFHTQWNQK